MQLSMPRSQRLVLDDGRPREVGVMSSMFMRTTDFHPQPVIDLGALAVLVLAVVLSASRRVALGEMRDARCEMRDARCEMRDARRRRE
jgi:hypothetical protein